MTAFDGFTAESAAGNKTGAGYFQVPITQYMYGKYTDSIEQTLTV